MTCCTGYLHQQVISNHDIDCRIGMEVGRSLSSMRKDFNYMYLCHFTGKDWIVWKANDGTYLQYLTNSEHKGFKIQSHNSTEEMAKDKEKKTSQDAETAVLHVVPRKTTRLQSAALAHTIQ